MNHTIPRKPQLSPHKFREVKYGSKTQLSPKKDTSKPLNDAGICWVQIIVGALLWIVRAVNKNILVALTAIGSQQASATEDTNKEIHQLLEYCVDMILAGHSDAGFNNETRAQSRAGAHIFFF